MEEDIMNLRGLLTKKREAVIGKWFNLIIDSYPPDTAHYLKNQKNPFSNPVGSTIHTAIEGIFDELLNPSDSVKVNTFLDNIIRIRAIQDFSPSTALNFLFLLKDVVRLELNKDIYEYNLFEDLLVFESQVDRLLRKSFDIYMECKEKIYELSANEIRNMNFQVLRNK